MKMLSDIINTSIWNILSEVNTLLPGKIVSIDINKCKATVKPLIKKRFTNGQVLAIEPIPNVPVIFQRTKNGHSYIPIEKGDFCLLGFMQRSIDNWVSSGGDIDPDDNRKFDLSDCIALPGLFPFTENFVPSATNSAEFKYKNTSLKLTGNKIRLGSSLVDIISQLSELVSKLSSAVVQVDTNTGTGGFNPATIAQLTAIKVLIDTLKE